MDKLPRLGPVMLDIESTVLNERDVRRLSHPMTGGVIIFARNFENRKQLVSLVAAVRKVRPDILIAVDHEGGRVQRFRTDGFTVLPPMRDIGALWDKDPAKAVLVARACGLIAAYELGACGIDLTFAPVLDIDYGTSGVIGNRAFHRDPGAIAVLAGSLMDGLACGGMANCGKHFPGHGYVTADSHTDVPVDERSFEEIVASDIKPYENLILSVKSVMPAHVIYKQVDDKPAGFSAKWLGYLKDTLGFDGMVFSDDLSMAGARVAGGVRERAAAALSAGCDMVLVCNAPEMADELLAGIAVSDAFVSSVSAKIARMGRTGAALSWDAMKKDPVYAKALAIVEAFKA